MVELKIWEIEDKKMAEFFQFIGENVNYKIGKQIEIFFQQNLKPKEVQKNG